MQTEREDKYEVDANFSMPGLAEFGQVTRVDLELVSVYYDTDGYDLLQNSVTLRRRSGDSDTGWHAKLPAGKARTEVRLPLGGNDDPVPAELAALTLGLRRGRPLRRVATLSVHRAAHRVLDPSGALLAEVADDTVLATASGRSMIASRWREVEVELGVGDEQVLAAIGRRLVRAGARPAASPSKLARALAPLHDGSRPAPKPLTRRTVGDVVLAYLLDQRTALLEGDLALRRGDDAIHPTRVATRRLRSTLRTFGDLLDADRSDRLDEELAWYAQSLGEVRERDVLGRHLAAVAAELPESLVPAAVSADIANRIAGERAIALAALLEELDGARYLDLLRTLDDWIESPPLSARAATPAPEIRRWVDRAEKKVTTRLRRGLTAADDEALHAARKAAKRARYAAELASPGIGAKAAARKIDTFTTLQDVLGEHQDSVVASAWLLANGAGVPAGGELIPTIHRFAYGLLYAGEVQRAASSSSVAREKLKHLR